MRSEDRLPAWRRKPEGTALLLTGLFAVLSCAPPPPGPGVVATSQVGEVTVEELESFILSLPAEERRPGEGQDLLAWRRSLVERLLFQEALEREAAEEGLLEEPEVRARLTDQTETLLVEEMRRRRLEPVGITEEELRAYYQAHPEEFGHDEQIRLRHIFRRVERESGPQEREEARHFLEELRRQILQGASFEELAKQHSQSETAALNGLIGRLNRGDLDPSLEEIVWSLEEGEMSRVVSTPVGFHLFRLDDRLPASTRPFEEIRNLLLRQLTERAIQEAAEEDFQELLALSGVVYRPEGLESEDPGEVLFALGEDRLTLGEWWDRLGALPFSAQRDEPQEAKLEELARRQVYLWKAGQEELARQPEVQEEIAEIRRRIAVAEALQRRLQERLDQVPEEELRTLYEESRGRFVTPELLRLRILTRSFPADESRWYTVREELAALAERIRAGEMELTEAARELSDDPLTARDGGDTGPIRLDALGDWAGPQVQKAVTALAVGELSEPLLIERYRREDLVYERLGYMLVRVEEVQPSRSLSFEEARQRVERLYAERQGEELQERLRQRVLASIGTRIFEDRLG